jgi:hypothetical protein
MEACWKNGFRLKKNELNDTLYVLVTSGEWKEADRKFVIYPVNEDMWWNKKLVLNPANAIRNQDAKFIRPCKKIPEAKPSIDIQSKYISVFYRTSLMIMKTCIFEIDNGTLI